MAELSLFPYQQDDLEAWKAAPQPRILWNCNQTGLGKTIDAIVCAKECDYARILIITLKSTRAQWAREFAKWWPERAPAAVFTHGFERKNIAKKRKAQLEFDLANPTHIVSWALASKLLDAVYARNLPLYDYIVVEEFHDYVDWWAGVIQALAQLRKLNPRADWKPLSGTPVNNDPLRSWAWLKLSEPHRWGELRGSESIPFAFRRIYGERVPNEYAYSGYVYKGVNPVMLGKFQAATAHLIRRKTAKDVALQLPAYRTMLRHYDEDVTAPEATADWVSEHAGEPVCVFTYNIAELDAISAELTARAIPHARIRQEDDEEKRLYEAQMALKAGMPFLATTGLVGTGVDYLSNFHVFLLAQPTSDANALQQLIGRFCRISSADSDPRTGYLLYPSNGWADQKALQRALEQNTAIVAPTALATAALAPLAGNADAAFLTALRQLGRELAASTAAGDNDDA